ncbi:MAG: hypothetical protein ACREHV_00665 [Rhizomicrobium sp.]
MNKVTPLRAAAALPSRTSARAALADVLAKNSARSERLAAINDAIGRIDILDVRSKLDAATEAVEKVRERSALDLVNNEGGRPGAGVRESRQALQDARDQYDAAKSAIEILEREKESYGSDLVRQSLELTRHIDAIIQADPAVEALIRHYIEAVHKANALGSAVSAMKGNFSDDQVRLAAALKDTSESWRPWCATLAALETDPDAAFPTVQETLLTGETPRPAA